MKKALIILDNGHGEDTPGKRSPDGTLLEYKYARDIVKRLQAALEQQGLDVHILVPETKDIPLLKRVDRANIVYLQNRKLYEKILLVSIHCNAATNSDWSNARGWSAFTSVGITQSDDACKYLYEAASIYLKEYISSFTSPDKRQRPIRDTKDVSKGWEKDFTILKKTKCPAVLTENLFQDNMYDVLYLLSEEGKQSIVDLHVAGILAWVYNYGIIPSIHHGLE